MIVVMCSRLKSIAPYSSFIKELFEMITELQSQSQQETETNDGSSITNTTISERHEEVQSTQ
jgi:hypothetical protein